MPNRQTPLIQADSLNLRINDNPILQDITLSLSAGEIVTVVGPNGSGKSTLLRALIGAMRPTSGRITRASGLRLGYVPQRLHIDPTLPLSVRRFLNLPRRHSRQAIDQALAQA